MLPKAKNVPNGRFATRMERNVGDVVDASARSGRLPCGRPHGGGYRVTTCSGEAAV